MTLRTRTYESENSYKDVFKLILLDVERDTALENPLFGNLTVETNKPWVGIIDSGNGTFKILRTNSFLPFRILEGNFFDIFIHGEVSVDGNKTRIEVKVGLSWVSAIFLLFTYLVPILMLTTFIVQNDWTDVQGLIGWVCVFSLIPTALLIVQLNRTEKLICDLLCVREHVPKD
ncbi:MAG: hypothetical protein J0L67_07040 [Cytophagales bacterium]|nr:hypothetical protein [Cytophagales bacterium]